MTATVGLTICYCLHVPVAAVAPGCNRGATLRAKCTAPVSACLTNKPKSSESPAAQPAVLCF